MSSGIWGKLGGAGIGLAIGGPLGALAGGVSTADNPTGLRSALCGATFSATLGFEISPAMRGR